MEYQKCPVCEGRGTLPCGFYAPAMATSSVSPEICKTCNGQGIIIKPLLDPYLRAVKGVSHELI